MCIKIEGSTKQYQLPRSPRAAKILKCASQVSKDIRINYIPKEVKKQSKHK